MQGIRKRQFSKASIAYIALGVVLISVMTALGLSAFLRIAEIRIEGQQKYTSEEIIAASGLNAGDNLMLVNSRDLALQIRTKLPFAEEVHVSRVLPNVVSIEIVESVAVARVTSAGWYYVLDSNCRVLAGSYGLSENEAVSDIVDDFESLIEIRGIEIEETPLGIVLKPVFGAETKLQYTQDILAAVERHGISDDVSYIDVSNITNVFFGYLGRYRVILGGSVNLRPSSIRHNLERLVESIPQINEHYPNTSGDINLSDDTAAPRFFPT
ncbi:MAG: FtsQ-type POTRA domain-containing protein [Oscillospiraceae bacterium]|nr:FtsQ-type POTRA domain-containing protein [Oscillospiraceae bacterium]